MHSPYFPFVIFLFIYPIYNIYDIFLHLISSVVDDYVACTNKCDLDTECVAWIFNQTDNNNTCYLQNITSDNIYSYGNVSGVKGKYSSSLSFKQKPAFRLYIQIQWQHL